MMRKGKEKKDKIIILFNANDSIVIFCGCGHDVPIREEHGANHL